ncbi:MAG TPA: hypothetical protein VMN57_12780 [Anaerolineales bacterium]|nr:hypothetical protein [Anaerolineales bacterium]
MFERRTRKDSVKDDLSVFPILTHFYQKGDGPNGATGVRKSAYAHPVKHPVFYLMVLGRLAPADLSEYIKTLPWTNFLTAANF